MLYLLVTALGVGCFFQAPLIGLQAAMPPKDMATSIGTFGLLKCVLARADQRVDGVLILRCCVMQNLGRHDRHIDWPGDLRERASRLTVRVTA